MVAQAQRLGRRQPHHWGGRGTGTGTARGLRTEQVHLQGLGRGSTPVVPRAWRTCWVIRDFSVQPSEASPLGRNKAAYQGWP